MYASWLPYCYVLEKNIYMIFALLICFAVASNFTYFVLLVLLKTGIYELVLLLYNMKLVLMNYKYDKNWIILFLLT